LELERRWAARVALQGAKGVGWGSHRSSRHEKGAQNSPEADERFSKARASARLPAKPASSAMERYVGGSSETMRLNIPIPKSTRQRTHAETPPGGAASASALADLYRFHPARMFHAALR